MERGVVEKGGELGGRRGEADLDFLYQSYLDSPSCVASG